MPGDALSRFHEDSVRWSAGRGYLIAHLVVKFEQRHVRLRDDQVFIVAMIADERETLRAAREIVAVVAGDATCGDVDVLADEELRARNLAIQIAGIACVELAA